MKKSLHMYNQSAVCLLFYRPYGWIAPLSWHWHYPPSKPIDWKKYSKDTDYNMGRITIPEKKYKTAAWLVSNCATGLFD